MYPKAMIIGYGRWIWQHRVGGRPRARAHNVPMSALKSQIGHPQGACGAAGVVATVLAMKRGQIPPTINLDNPDPACDLDYVPRCWTKAPDSTRPL